MVVVKNYKWAGAAWFYNTGLFNPGPISEHSYRRMALGNLNFSICIGTLASHHSQVNLHGVC